MMKRLLLSLVLAGWGGMAASEIMQKVGHLKGDLEVVAYRSVSPLRDQDVEALMRGLVDRSKTASFIYLYPYNARMRDNPFAGKKVPRDAIRIMLRSEEAADWRWSLKYIQESDTYTFIDCATPNPKCNPGVE